MASVQMMGGQVTGEINSTVKTYIKKISNDTKKGLDDNGGSTRGDKRPSSNEQGGSGQNDSNNEAKPKNVKNGSTRKGSGREVLKARNPKSHVIGNSSTIKEVEEDFYEMTKNSPVEVTLTTTEEFISKFSPQNERQSEILKHVALMRSKIRARVANGTPRSEATTVAGFYVSGEHIYLFADGIDKAEFKDNKANQLQEVFTHEFRHFMNYQEKVEENGRNYNETSELSSEIVNSKIEGVTIATIVKLHGRSREALKKTLHSLCGHQGYDDLKMSKLANEISAFAAGRKISGKEYVLPGYPPLSETLTKFLDKTINETRSKLNGNDKGGIPIPSDYRQSSSGSDATNTKGTSRNGRIRSANRSEEEGTTDGIDIFDADDEISFSFAGNEGTEEFKSRKELEESKQFKEWNGGNEIVREEDSDNFKFETGKPFTAVAYHGTDAMFNSFNLDRAGSRGFAFGPGYYFSDSKEFSSSYKTNDGRLIEAYVKFEKPILYNAILSKAEVKGLYEAIKATKEGDKLNDYKNAQEFVDARYDDYIRDLMNNLKDLGIDNNVLTKALYDSTGYDGYVANLASDDVKLYIPIVSNHIKTTGLKTETDRHKAIPQDQRFSDDDDIRLSVAGNEGNDTQTTNKTNKYGTEEKNNSESQEREYDNSFSKQSGNKGNERTNQSESENESRRGDGSSINKKGVDEKPSRLSIKEVKAKEERHTLRVTKSINSLNKSKVTAPHITTKREFLETLKDRRSRTSDEWKSLSKSEKLSLDYTNLAINKSSNNTKEILFEGETYIFSDALRTAKDIQGAYYRIWVRCSFILMFFGFSCDISL